MPKPRARGSTLASREGSVILSAAPASRLTPPVHPIPTTRWLEHLARHLAVAREGVDPEGVHQLRVASGRLSVWLELAGWRVLRDDLSWLRGSGGRVRELDVLLADDLPEAFSSWLRERRGDERQRLLCKELLFILEQDYQGPIEMTAANFTSKNQWQMISYQELQERDAQSTFSEPQRYLYEPNSSLMKLAPFKWIGRKYNIRKLHPNTHLYTSHELLAEFPGRIFEIEWTSAYRPQKIKKLLSGQANVSVRNFPSDVKSIRKKCGLTDGGKDYLFATTGPDGQPMVINGQKVTTAKSER